MTPLVLNSPQYKVAETMRLYGTGNCIMVTRGSHWGNPFPMLEEKDRDRVCDGFEAYAHWRLAYEPHWLDALKDKHLICVCAPKRCHADTLLRLANDEGDHVFHLGENRDVYFGLVCALTGLLEIGKRDQSNPKYDSCWEFAYDTLKRYKCGSNARR